MEISPDFQPSAYTLAVGPIIATALNENQEIPWEDIKALAYLSTNAPQPSLPKKKSSRSRRSGEGERVKGKGKRSHARVPEDDDKEGPMQDQHLVREGRIKQEQSNEGEPLIQVEGNHIEGGMKNDPEDAIKKELINDDEFPMQVEGKRGKGRIQNGPEAEVSKVVKGKGRESRMSDNEVCAGLS